MCIRRVRAPSTRLYLCRSTTDETGSREEQGDCAINLQEKLPEGPDTMNWRCCSECVGNSVTLSQSFNAENEVPFSLLINYEFLLLRIRDNSSVGAVNIAARQRRG